MWRCLGIIKGPKNNQFFVKTKDCMIFQGRAKYLCSFFEFIFEKVHAAKPDWIFCNEATFYNVIKRIVSRT